MKICLNLFYKAFILIFLSFLTFSCMKEKAENKPEGIIAKKKRIEPNLTKRLENARDQGGGIFNSSRSQKKTTYEFATSNPLWRAAITTLEKIPLTNVDYSGGVILTDWYSPDINSEESVKIKIQFVSNEVRASSINVVSHKRTCQLNNCKIVSLDNNFNSKIKNAVINKARDIEIKDEDEKNKK